MSPEPLATWRFNFVRFFFENLFLHEPSFNTDIVFTKNNTTSSSPLRVAISHTGDFHFIQNLRNVLQSIETHGTGDISYEVQDITGGLWVFQENFNPSQFFQPKDYNSTSPLEQWNSQHPLGYQVIFQMENFNLDVKLSNDIIRKALDSSLSLMSTSPTILPYGESTTVYEYTDLGKGSLIVCLWSRGSVLVLWDGKVHVDINLFFYNEYVLIANSFVERFTTQLPSLSIILRDEQPRGIGRIVNFQNDIDRFNEKPYWSMID